MNTTLHPVFLLLICLLISAPVYSIQPSHGRLDATKARMYEIERALTLIKSSEGKSDLSNN